MNVILDVRHISRGFVAVRQRLTITLYPPRPSDVFSVAALSNCPGGCYVGFPFNQLDSRSIYHPKQWFNTHTFFTLPLTLVLFVTSTSDSPFLSLFLVCCLETE